MIAKRIVSVVLVAFAALPGFCQELASEQRVTVEPRARTPVALEEIRRATFRMDVKMVQIPVTVTDLRDRPVMGLDKTRFRIFEDDVEQEISAFSMADATVSAGIVFDTSGSMRAHLGESREAIEQFLKSSVDGDEYFLVRFADHPKLAMPLTPLPDLISRELSGVHAQGWTAMNGALFLCAKEMRHAANSRRVLLVLTDGADNNSRYSDAELLSMMRELDAGFFAIGLFERPRILEKLADESGGRVIWVRKITELPEAMEKLSLQIRNQYVIGYFPEHPHNDGRYHRIRVEVQPPADASQIRATWRRGYLAP